MTSNRPYLIRAMYDWMMDNYLTPHVVVRIDHPHVSVPAGYDQEGQIVLNLSPNAVKGLDLGNEYIQFNARFGGTPTQVVFPPGAVLGIYARENGQGMLFPDEETSADSDQEAENPATADKAADPATQEDATDGGRPPRGRPHLKVVK